MDSAETLRFIKGLIKKHGKDFSLNLKYMTANNKIKKRHGRFVSIVDDHELILLNQDKGSENRFEVSRILEIERRD
ncbi:MAG: hypothetical protein PHI06_12735 [Desulfobulbaceae bacterium]|nr:hypothetical protein [Desulfobulbaceae bacterium]